MPEPISLALSLGLGYVALASYGLSSANTALSQEARDTRIAFAGLIESKEKSYSLFGKKAKLIAEMNDLGYECSDDDWDGYGALAIDPLVVWNTKEFIRALPDNIPLPEVSPDPDGSISLDWIRSRNEIVSVSIGTKNRFAIAWVGGTERGHAVVNFDGLSIPELVLNRIGNTSYVNASLWSA